jgi:F0F1-type ATP synthase assembly protein I
VASPSDPENGRSSIAVAYIWAWRVIAISLEMVIPGLVGYWIDTQLGTKALFMIGGFVLGMAASIVHLIQIARGPSKPDQ